MEAQIFLTILVSLIISHTDTETESISNAFYNTILQISFYLFIPGMFVLTLVLKWRRFSREMEKKLSDELHESSVTALSATLKLETAMQGPDVSEADAARCFEWSFKLDVAARLGHASASTDADAAASVEEALRQSAEKLKAAQQQLHHVLSRPSSAEESATAQSRVSKLQQEIATYKQQEFAKHVKIKSVQTSSHRVGIFGDKRVRGSASVAALTD